MKVYRSLKKLLQCALCSLREMKSNSCGRTKTTTAAETSLSQTCHDIRHSTSKNHADKADADQYSDVFTVDDAELTATDVTGSLHQQPITSEDEEEREDEMWCGNTEDSTTICGISLDNVDDDEEDRNSSTNAGSQAQLSHLLIHAADEK